MDVYEFEMHGGKKVPFYLVEDVRHYFGKGIYNEDVRRAMSTIKAEIRMRQQVFARDRVKRDRKVAEMEQVLRVLSRFSDKFPELQKEFL